MTATLNPTCPLCGLHFDSRPLLDLHIREDHRPRARRDPGGAETLPRRVASPATHRPGPGRTMTRPRRVIHALRHVNDELTRAGDAIIRSARVPQPRRAADQPGHPGQATEAAKATEAANRDTAKRVGQAA